MTPHMFSKIHTEDFLMFLFYLNHREVTNGPRGTPQLTLG